MAIYTHERQERYSALVLKKLRKGLVLKDGIVFNTDYEGTPTAGAVKIPVRDSEVSVGDYVVATGKPIAYGSTTYLDVLINKDKAVNELIDGYEAESVPDRLLADRLDSAGYSLSLQIDDDGGTELITNGTTNNVGLISKDDVYSAFVDIRTKMSKANIPATGRYALVTPDFYALLLKSTEFIKASDLGDAVVQSGAIGSIAGFTLYEWNDDTPGLRCICGHPAWATRVLEWKVPVTVTTLPPPHIGASSVNGRMVYAHKVTRAAAIQVIYAPSNFAGAGAEASAATSGKTKVTGVGATGTAKYKLNPATRVVYGQADTGFTALTTEATTAVGDIIEVVDFVGGAATSVKYIEVTAEMIKA